MNNKLSSLCIMTALLLGSSTANAAYYYYRSQPYQVVAVTTCGTCNVCTTCQVKTHCPCSVKKHHYRHTISHHSKHYYASPHHAPRSYYSISTYYVYSTPFGDSLWVPSCHNGCVSAEDYHNAFYGPYYPAGVTPYQYSDFDMDTRTGDDVYDEY